MLKKRNIVILGAGIAGLSVAREVAKKGYNVTIIEKSDQVLSGASGRHPGRMGHGFHYHHLPTAIHYLRETIVFKRLIEGEGTHFRATPRGRYFITNNSKPSCEDVLKVYQALKNEYAELCNIDSKNKVLGEVDEFFRIMDPQEYKNDVTKTEVAVGIETTELLLDLDSYKKSLKAELNRYKNIIFIFNSEVFRLARNQEQNYLIYYNQKTSKSSEITSEIKSMHAEFIVNCTWENVEKFNYQLGFPMKEERSNRLKALSVVEINKEFSDKPSMFFCMGEGAMFSNLGLQTIGKYQGRYIGMITCATETNRACSMDTDVPAYFNLLLDGKKSLQEDPICIGNRIIFSASRYMPWLKQNVTLLETRYGIVKTKGKYELGDPNSAYNRRDYSGFEFHEVGYLSFSSMKFAYGPPVAKKIAEIIDTQYLLKESRYLRVPDREDDCKVNMSIL